MEQNKKFTLYTYFRSSTSWRVRIVLNYKNIPHDFKFVHLLKGENATQQYKNINPNAAVPSLILPNGQVLIQSMAICQYLEETNKQNPLLPSDPIKKAQIRGFCQLINSGMHPYQNLRLIKKVNQQLGADKIQWGKYWVNRGMQTLQAMLKKSKGKYCFGDQVTLADTFFAPQVQGGIARFGVQIQKYPLCKEVLQNLQQIQAFKLAQPKNQPDFQK